MSVEKDLYAILGASPTDSVQQLRHKYQKLALQCHPDRLGDVCDIVAETSRKMFLEIDAAWKILCEDETRKTYDQQRRARELKQDWPVDSVVSLEDMTWDQDELAYTYSCRCGGQFSFSEEELERRIDEEKTNESQHVVVCCDTCSLSLYVK
ncbi:dnaJ homolog subfamily C member 24 [Corythoichthys intestinalis]|uniref:dnaJ homolog subfamily C member 24 n=1 Tax=Corythoichthys intestinalis TaxID=161448 RepID=UPI0025A5823C|nr:dnaJ homolog subfamily C member 24 [Corythoichthys intestinalis]XP_057693653.1 dnaJ homolog subfamily C member 24 [Corythoichthys intestinalis]